MSSIFFPPAESHVNIGPLVRFFFIMVAVGLVSVALSAPAVTIAASLTLAVVIPALVCAAMTGRS